MKVFLTCTAALVVCFGFAGDALAVHDLGLFQLDGNAQQAVPTGALGDDWDNLLLGGTGHALTSTGLLTDLTGKLETTFGIGSKDTLPISGWSWQTNSAPNKDDLLHAYAAIYRNPANQHLIVYFGADRFNNGGDSQIGFWFFQHAVGPVAGGTWSGTHAIGDVLVLSNFTIGGTISTIDVYQWVGSGGSDGSLNKIDTGVDCSTSPVGDTVCGIVNSANQPSPWSFQSSGPHDPPNTFLPGEFFEAGLDLTAELPSVGCLSTFLAETRSSSSLTASLEDYVLGNFDTCHIDVTKTGPSISKVGDTPTYTYTITNKSIATMYLQSVTDNVIGNLQTQAIAGNCGTLAPNASCTFTATYTVLVTDPNPLANTVTAIYNDLQNFTGNQVTGTANFSVPLFTPSVTVVKNGPTLAQDGSTVTYSFTITNNGSVNSPVLNLVTPTGGVVDNVLGDLTALAAAHGCSTLAQGASCTFSSAPTVVAVKDSPLTNTVTVHYRPSGFTNDISAHASHTVTIFKPGVTIAKTGDALGKVGDPINYSFTITNTSGPNTPPLVLDTFSDPLIPSLVPPASCSPLALGASCTFTATRTPVQGDPNPVVNTVSVTYHATGFATALTASSSWSTPLFSPAVSVTKNGPTLSEVGATATYTFTITNTGSSNSPALNLVGPTGGVVDTVLGDLTALAQANGCGTLATPGGTCSFTKDYLVPANAPNPVVNTVSVLYHPTGFPNNVTNSASHTMPLFVPSVKIVKTGDALGKIGDPVNYTFTITNTSTANAPNLVLDTFSDPLIPALVAPAACSPLAPGASCTFTATRTPVQGDPNPVVNSVSVSYHPTGFTNAVTSSSSWSTALFTPGVVVTKSGPSLSEAGATATYTFTITNTGSSNSPALNLVVPVGGVVDSVLGDLTALAQANGCGTLATPSGTCTFSVNYLVPAGGPNPVVNVVSVLYHPAGFPNNVTSSASHSMPLFAPSVTIVKTGDATGKVGDPINYQFTIMNTSTANTPPLVLDSINDPLIPGLTPAANCSPLAVGASCTFSATYTPLPSDPTPLINPVSVFYHPTGFALSITASSSWSTNLFKPSVSVTKTGPSLATTGDVVTYTFTITNTSGANTPSLILVSPTGGVIDSVIGDLTGSATTAGCGTLPFGGSCTFTATHTVVAGDPNPLVNTVTVLYHPNGFPNNVTNSASHTLNLFQPSFTIAKTGDALSKIGDPVTYTFTITNTSTANTPALMLQSIIDDKVGPLAAPPTCSPLASGASCTFSVPFTIPLGAADPFVNTVTAVYTVQAGGLLQHTLSQSASHSTDLFQPSVMVAKNGPSLATLGDVVTYSFTITDTSSSDTPNLALVSPAGGVVDSVIGDLTAAAVGGGCGTLASGGSCTFTATHTVGAGDPDPLVNTVTVNFTIPGFPNKVSASAIHSLNLFQPGFTIAKTNSPLSKIGDQYTSTYMIVDTSSPDSPPITLIGITDTNLGNLFAAATAAGCGSLVSGGSCTFTVPGVIPAGSPNPFTNTVTATYQDSGVQSHQMTQVAQGFTPLFQPSVTVVKTGPQWEIAGNTATYKFVIQNTSSGNTPTLVLPASGGVMDSLMGDITSQAGACATLAQGASCSFTASRQVLAGDPNPLINTVQVNYTISGFPNIVSANSHWQIQIIHPNYTLAKTCLTNPVNAGASANFRINMANTGDVPLIIQLQDTLLSITQTVALGVNTSGVPCDTTVNDPANGCYMIEAGIIATGTQVFNNAVADATLPAPYNGQADLAAFIDHQESSATCAVQTPGATRTPGFWKTHTDYTTHVFTVHLGGSINLGWKLIDGVDDVFGMFYASMSKQSTNQKRDALCQARMIASYQALAAILNSALTNGAPLPVPLSQIQSTLAGTDIAAIQALGTLLGNYNGSGDTVAVVDGDGYIIQHATPSASKAAADIPFADCNTTNGS